MRREEAIDILKAMLQSYLSLGIPDPEAVGALEMAINAVEAYPCEDCISRREAIKMFTYNYKGERIPDYDCDNFPVQIAMKTVKEILRELPPVNPQPKTGHWILTSDDDYEYCTCSECGYQNGENWMIGSHIKFCQECGAKMVEPQESEGKA